MKILHLDINHPVLLEKLTQAGCINEIDITSTYHELLAKVAQYDGIVLRSRVQIDANLLSAAPRLKFVARVGAGMENIDVQYAAQQNIVLFSAPEGNRNAVGEHTLGMLLALLNKLTVADRQIRAGQWLRESNRGTELEGKTVGIIGYGNTGKSFAKKLSGFDLQVLCYDIKSNLGDQYAKQVPLEVIQSAADILSLHIPYTSQTDGMVNHDFIHHFSKPFYLINTSRGKNIITDHVVDALKKGKILGAALDVLEYEKSSFEYLQPQSLPPSLQYLLQADNVLLTPHVAGWTVESHYKLAEVIAEKIIRFALFEK